jgi:hypothetical protein
MNNNFPTGEVCVDQEYSEDLIRVGSSHFSKCPMCGECFSLKWPNRVHRLPADAVVHIECPQYRHEFTETAGGINVASANVHLAFGLVRRIEPASTIQQLNRA